MSIAMEQIRKMACNKSQQKLLGSSVSSMCITKKHVVMIPEETDLAGKYELLLRKAENDENLVIHEAEEEAGTKPGQNYLSTVLRTRVSGRKGNGKPFEKSFIRKLAVADEYQRKLSRSADLFRVEAHIYEHISVVWGNVGPQCIFAQSDEIILDDLSQKQYSIHERAKFLDFHECRAVMQFLASMHSKSLSVKLKEPKFFESVISKLGENIFPVDDGPALCDHYETGLADAVKALQEIQPCTSKIDCCIKFLLQYRSRAVLMMRELLSPSSQDSDRYWVVTHGDAWKNNLMFKHNSEGQIVNVKFIDYQVARHSSAAIDLTYFIYTSARTDVIQHHFEDLIAEYEKFFLHGLRLAKVSESDLKHFSRPGWLIDELKRYGLFGFLVALTTVNAAFLDEKTALLYEKSKTGVAVDIPAKVNTKEQKERILFMVDHYKTYFQTG